MAYRCSDRADGRLSEIPSGGTGVRSAPLHATAFSDEPKDGERVWHFDQLDGDQQGAFLEMVDGKPVSSSLPSDTVIVFTDYYRIERVS